MAGLLGAPPAPGYTGSFGFGSSGSPLGELVCSFSLSDRHTHTRAHTFPPKLLSRKMRDLFVGCILLATSGTAAKQDSILSRIMFGYVQQGTVR